jgi:hypothetical protein
MFLHPEIVALMLHGPLLFCTNYKLSGDKETFPFSHLVHVHFCNVFSVSFFTQVFKLLFCFWGPKGVLIQQLKPTEIRTILSVALYALPSKHKLRIG